jgi:hypothetical protein
MPGPPPKPAHLRQRTNKKSTHARIWAPEDPEIPPIPNPGKRKWHKLTLASWAHAWASPMATQWLETDADALGRLAVLWDIFYRAPDADALKEIRMQSALFGLSPLDRSRLQWEVSRADEAEHKASKREVSARKIGAADPRRILQMVGK